MGTELKRKQIIELLKSRIKSNYRDLLFMKNNLKEREDWIEGFRSRLDELLLLWHEIHDISFTDACQEFGVNYEDVNTSQNKTNGK